MRRRGGRGGGCALVVLPGTGSGRGLRAPEGWAVIGAQGSPKPTGKGAQPHARAAAFRAGRTTGEQGREKNGGTKATCARRNAFLGEEGRVSPAALAVRRALLPSLFFQLQTPRRGNNNNNSELCLLACDHAERKKKTKRIKTTKSYTHTQRKQFRRRESKALQPSTPFFSASSISRSSVMAGSNTTGKYGPLTRAPARNRVVCGSSGPSIVAKVSSPM